MQIEPHVFLLFCNFFIAQHTFDILEIPSTYVFILEN